jgi:hypothetical protein
MCDDKVELTPKVEIALLHLEVLNKHFEETRDPDTGKKILLLVEKELRSYVDEQSQLGATEVIK